MTGSELKSRRQALGLTQLQFARVLARFLGREVTPFTISKWEQDLRKPVYPEIIKRALDTLEAEKAATAR